MPLALPLITLAILFFFPLSLYLLRRGLRGRPTGDHPICSRCSFDLFNRPETSTRCPECGSDLTAPRAILPGTRRRRPALVFCSLALLALTLVATAKLTYRIITDPGLIPLQPTFALPLHFRYGPLSAAALDELQFRILAHQAPASAADGVIARILSLQANPKVNWNPVHGNFIEALDRYSFLPAADRAAYIRQCATFTARIRPNVRIGNPIPLELTLTTRVGSRQLMRPEPTGNFTLAVAFDNQSAGSPVRLFDRPLSIPVSYSSSFRYNLLPHTYGSLPPGPHTAHVTTEFVASLPDNAHVTCRQSFDLPFTLHPADQPAVRLLDDPALRDRVAHAIQISVEDRDYLSANLVFRIRAPNSACALAYDVTFRAGTREYGRSSFAIARDSPDSVIVSPDTSNLPAHVDLILHPSPDVAATTTSDITEICAGDIVLHDVPTAPGSSFTPAAPTLPTSRP